MKSHLRSFLLVTAFVSSGCTTYPIVDRTDFNDQSPKKVAVAGFQSTVIYGNYSSDSYLPISDMDHPYQEFLKDLGDTKKFDFISDEKLAASPVYQNFPAPALVQGPVVSYPKLSSAGNLHPVATDIAAVPQLAKKIGADIIIFVNNTVIWSTGVDKTGHSLKFVLVSATLKAVSSSGIVVWEDRFDTQSAARRTSDGTATPADIQKLADDALTNSSRDLVKRFSASLVQPKT
jgi:hypothetical protein